MVRKSFISLSFASQSKLQVMQLTPDKKKVKKYISLALPEGLIVSSRVQDERALAIILKEIWKKIGLREKSVGIVIPESSTFTKLLKLPTLSSTELDEAVRWQVSDFLPVKPTEVVMDWKKIKVEGDSTTVLAVAIPKVVLRGYVAAAGLAGLFPQVVETPSLSLSRFLEKEEKGSLIVYGNFGEVILVVSEGRKIVGSSVVSASDVDEILNVSSRMIRHYSDVKVAKVAIGGPLISQDLVKRLQETLKVPVEWIKVKVGGLDGAKLQDYLIPISLQLKDPARPADETTVNLLPSELVTKYSKKRLRLQIWSVTLIISLVVWLTFFSTLGFYLFFGQQIKFYQPENVLNQIPHGNAKVIQQIAEINAVSNRVLKITSSTIAPQIIFNSIAQALPPDVTVARYRIDLDTGEIEVIGISATRQALIDFKQALEEVTDFSLVQIPISSFEKEAELQYSARFTYLPAIGNSQLVPEQ
ncbi:pilus assembly protein PilM [Patescibacteria group bacterium]|nr:pilus assembly protein PilM [Patescibacteria group bacterium]